MNGWRRIGIAISVTWFVLVTGYAAYERIFMISIPIFETQSSPPSIEDYNSYFFEISWKEDDESIVKKQKLEEEKSLSDKTPIKLPTIEEIRAGYTGKIIHGIYSPYGTTKTYIKNTLFLSIIIPVILLWVLCYIFIYVVKWIREGFQ